MDQLSQITDSCRTCSLNPFERPSAQHTVLATQSGCFAIIILGILSGGYVQCTQAQYV